MDRTLIEVTLKGTEGDSRTYSVVSLWPSNFWNKKTVSRLSSVARESLRPSSFKNASAIEQMGPRVSKTKGKKMCVVAISTYFSSLSEAASSAALQTVTEVDVK